MSNILTINTEDNSFTSAKIEPLPLYPDTHYMLGQVMPEFADSLPNPSMSTLVSRLRLTMKLYSGLGLSANQCGVQERVFVMMLNNNVVACINPKVLESSTELDKTREGCLSFPGMYLTIPRNEWIMVEFTDENGVVNQGRLEGISARCFLHELDHMNGIRFTDRVGSLAVKMAREKQSKLVKKVQRQKKGK